MSSQYIIVNVLSVSALLWASRFLVTFLIGRITKQKESSAQRGLRSHPKKVSNSVPTNGPQNIVEHSTKDELNALKDIYHKIHNLESNKAILPVARQRLVSMLSEALANASTDSKCQFLTLSTYTPAALATLMESIRASTASEWDEYIQKRKSGSSRDLFHDYHSAKRYLEQIAPAKCVDGAWLGHIHRVSTPFIHRNATVDAWQVLSEELGDGDLEKHHVHIYSSLLAEIGSKLPSAHDVDFIHQRHNLNSINAWRAAVAQLLISLFPHDFLPEILGFNLHFEGITIGTLKLAHELKEVKIDPSYFVLHVTIDNADSGHTAIAMQSVIKYLRTIQEQDGEAAMQAAWRRIQSGYILSERCDSSCDRQAAPPTQISFRSLIAEEVATIFAAKAIASRGVHCTCRIRVGRRSLSEWLDPSAILEKQWRIDFLEDLSNCKYLVRRGDAESSKLVRDLCWGGKMFGSFTHREVELVKEWIQTLDEKLDSSFYWDFTGRLKSSLPDFGLGNAALDVRADYPVLSVNTTEVPLLKHEIDWSSPPTLRSLTIADAPQLIPLWFAQQCLLEGFVSVPSKSANLLSCSVVRLLRCQYGFEKELAIVSGMDEARRSDRAGLVDIGLELCQTCGITGLQSLQHVLNRFPDPFCITMLQLSMESARRKWTLLGMSYGFLTLQDAVARSDLLDAISKCSLQLLIARERVVFSECLKRIPQHGQERTDFSEGFAWAQDTFSSYF